MFAKIIINLCFLIILVFFLFYVLVFDARSGNKQGLRVNIAKDQFQLELAVAKRHPRVPVAQNYVFDKKWETHYHFFVA